LYVAVWRDSRPLPGTTRVALSAYGYLLFFVGTVATAILAREAEVVCVLLVTMVFAGLFSSRSLRLLLHWQIWVFVLPTLALSPLLIGDRDFLLWGVMLSQEGFWAGVWMVTRALSIALAAAAFARMVSVAQMAQLFEGLRLKGLGFALGVATNVLPTIRETIDTSYHAMRLRGGFRSRRLHTLKLLLVTVIAGSLQRGDDIVWAAEARAFDPARSQGQPIVIARADVALAAYMGALALVLLIL
jgi:energy-coupling factor transporter transmembrane protein EcfT